MKPKSKKKKSPSLGYLSFFFSRSRHACTRGSPRSIVSGRETLETRTLSAAATFIGAPSCASIIER